MPLDMTACVVSELVDVEICLFDSHGNSMAVSHAKLELSFHGAELGVLEALPQRCSYRCELTTPGRSQLAISIGGHPINGPGVQWREDTLAYLDHPRQRA